MGILIDTCIWIDVEQGKLQPVEIVAVTGDEPVYLSPITIAEMKFGVECAPTQAIRQQRSAALAKIRLKPVLQIDGTTGEIFGSLAAQLKMNGRSHRHRIHDVWLSSQAIQHGFKFLTRNLRDFEDIPGLQILTV